MSRASLLRLLALAAVLVALAALPLVLPVQEPIREFLDWARGLGPWGLVALALFWIPAAILLVPGTLITLAGGALFGVPEAAAAISLGSTAGACAAFLVGRGVARPWAERQLAANPRFLAIDQAIAASGFRVVLLLRLSPVFPFNLLNYALALTRVSFRDYALASWLGMFPGTLLYVYVGSTVRELALLSSRRERGPAEIAFFYVGLALTVLVTAYVTRLAKRALTRAIVENDGEPGASAPGGRQPPSGG